LRRLRHCLAVLAIGVTVTPVAAGASNPVLQQCRSGSLTEVYSVAQLRQALSLLTAAEKQYTSCQVVIQQALSIAVAHRLTKAPVGSAATNSLLPTPLVVGLVIVAVVGLTLAAIAVRRRRGNRDP
jgi:uncharacterized membrane protein